MGKKSAENSRELLVNAGVDLFRRHGYAATTVDQICAAAGVTKGAFFHHFDSKEALAEATLDRWKSYMAAAYERAPFQTIADPRARLSACMDFFIQMMSDPQQVRSCLAGTIVQEISESHDRLREAAQACFLCGESHFAALVEVACRDGPNAREVDSASLAQLWMATIQGSLLLAKASGDAAVIARNMQHAKRYIESALGAGGMSA
jgi:TetR/AcrR family transcriptional repressor of nem operon